MNLSPEKIFAEYEFARKFKASIGSKGLYEQNRINERFFVGDQWHGAMCGNDRPLVRHNIVKRIGDYKIAQLAGSQIAVSYSAEGFSQTLSSDKTVQSERKELARLGKTLFAPLKSENEIGLMISALNSYRKTTADRVRLSEILDTVLRDSFIRGTGVVYTYFDPDIKTGLYADRMGGTPIMGDIVCERIKIEDVYLGDPECTELQKQPYIILKEEKTALSIATEAERFGAGERRCRRIAENGEEKQTLFTKLYKVKDKQGRTQVFATKVTEKEVIRPPFSIGIASYPISFFVWERRDGCAYGDSEITYIIPNQIAINRMTTAGVWSAMSAGMPLMVVNGDLVTEDITNEPGQIIKAYGSAEELSSAVRFVNPPDFSSGYNDSVNNLILNTLTQCGANEAALGDMDADNTSAIIELRDASSKHLAPLKNRYLRFIEDISLIWSEFFFSMYGKRCLKICDENGIWYFPFDAARYKDIILSVSVTAFEGITRSERETFTVLTELLDKGAITPAQYLARLPVGIIADSAELAEETKGGVTNERI